MQLLKKFFSIFILFFFFTVFGQSQNVIEYIKKHVTGSDIVVEANVVRKVCFLNEGKIMTKNIFEITKILKGTIGGEFEIVTQGGSLNGVSSIVSHSTQFYFNENCVYFLKKNHDSYSLVQGGSGYIRMINEKGYIPCIKRHISNWDVLLAGIVEISNGAQLSELDIDPSDKEICLKLDSIQVLGGDSRTNKFSGKLFIKSDVTGTKLASISTTIVLPSLEDDYPVSNGLIQIVPSNLFSNYNFIISDSTNSEIFLSFESDCQDFSSQVNLDLNYIELATITFDVPIEEIISVSDSSYFSTFEARYYNPNINDCTEFENICIGEGKGKGTQGKCTIASIDMLGEGTHGIGAGIGNTVLITGSGFKDYPGSVDIPDADIDKERAIKLGANYLGGVLVSWTDTQIEVELNAKDGINGIMGSGKWWVDPSGILNECYKEFNVDFSMQQGEVTDSENGNSTTLKKATRRFALKDPQDGVINYYLDNSIDSNDELDVSFSDIEKLVKEALCEWEGKIGISMNYGGPIDPSEGNNNTDGKVVIRFLPNLSNSLALEETTLTIISPCSIISMPNVTQFPYAFDAVIDVLETVKWYDKNKGGLMAGNEQDFYSVILHEIGHSLGLDHAQDIPRNSTEDVRAMYYGFEAGVISRNKIDNGDVNGGDYIGAKSRFLLQNATTTACKNNFKLNNIPFCSLTSLVSVQSKNVISIYPNPIIQNDVFFIENKSDEFVEISIFDSVGRLMQKFSLHSNSVNESTFNDRGIFFVVIQNNHNSLTRKIVVQ